METTGKTFKTPGKDLKNLVKKRVLAFLAVLMLAAPVPAALTGCGGDQGGGGEAEQPRDELILAIRGEPSDGFDPTTGWGRYGAPLFQSTLLKRDNDLNLVGDLAERYDKSADGLTWTFYLKKDIRFSDGSPLTAKDVVFTFETAAKNSSVVDLQTVKTAKAKDDLTVEITLERPLSTFVNVAATLGIVPAASYGDDYAQNPIGSGPFKLVQWDKGQQIIVERNPEYYGKEPAFKKITFLYLNEEAAFAAAKAGKVDVAAIASPLAKQEVKGMKVLPVHSVDNRGICFPCVKSGGKTEKGYPVGNDVTADPAIRKAINYAADREALVEGALLGFGTPAYSICDNLPWWNPETKFEDGDTEKAKKILADAGWKDSDGDGVLEKDGLKAAFTLIYPADDQIRQTLAIAMADSMKAIGLDISVDGKSWDEIETLMYANPVLFGWGSHDPSEMYNVYAGENAGKYFYNTSYYKNGQVDRYMEEALGSLDDEEANRLWQKAQWDGTTGFSALGDAPWAWLVNLDHVYLVKEGLDLGQNRIEPHGHGWPITANIEEWRWEEEK